MSTATATKSAPRTPTLTDVAAEADAAVTAADAAVEQARQAAADARGALAAAEAELVDALADGAARPQIEKIRERVDLARTEVDYAEVDVEAAEVRFSRSADTAAAAHRAIMREQYIAAQRDNADPDSRERQLRARITADTAELIRLVADRQDRDNRLAAEYASWPPEERAAMPVIGAPLQTYSHRGLGRWDVSVPAVEVAEAIKAAVAAAESGGH